MYMRTLDSKDTIVGLEHLTLGDAAHPLPLALQLDGANIARSKLEFNGFLKLDDLPLLRRCQWADNCGQVIDTSGATSNPKNAENAENKKS